MFIHIHFQSSTPIYIQIGEQIKHAIAAQIVKTGEQLPSVRELAMQLRVNPNTISKAYRELEREKIVFSRKGKGVFVSEIKNPLSQQEREDLVGIKIEYALVEGLSLGFTVDEIKGILDKRAVLFLNKIHNKE